VQSHPRWGPPAVAWLCAEFHHLGGWTTGAQNARPRGEPGGTPSRPGGGRPPGPQLGVFRADAARGLNARICRAIATPKNTIVRFWKVAPRSLRASKREERSV